MKQHEAFKQATWFSIVRGDTVGLWAVTLVLLFALALSTPRLSQSAEIGSDAPAGPTGPPRVGAADLLDGLQGYPAAELTKMFNRCKKRICVVNKTTDGQDAQHQEGTLRHFVETAKKQKDDTLTWIIFDPKVFPPEGNGAIQLREKLLLGNNTILDGRGAKVTLWSPLDIHLVQIRDVRNVILKNLILHKVAPYAREKFVKKLDFPVKPGPQVDADRALKGVNRDGVSIRGRADNIWLDHCTLFLCGDESIGMSNIAGPGQTKVTVSWCYFFNQYYVALIGQTREDYLDDKRIRFTFHHNRIRGAARRSPRVNRATADIYNNYYEGWVDWAVAANANSKVLIEGNIFQPRAGASRMAVNIGTTNQIEGFVRTENNSLLSGAKTDSNEAERVSVPTYTRSVEKPDGRLQKRIRTGSGWRNLNVDFSTLKDSN